MPQLSPADDLAIRATVQSLVEAWHCGDAQAFAAAFAEDAAFINVFAQTLDGREAIARHHAELFATVYRGTRISGIDMKVMLVHPDVATVAWSSVLHVGEERRPAHALTVFVRNADGWQIRALHNMVPLAAPG